MRAKIASRAHGHALEKRFLELKPAQLLVLYRQAMVEEEEAKREQIDLIRAVNDIWMQNFSTLFKDLQFFVNPQMFKMILEMKDLEKHREEVSAEEFPELWENIMKVIPQTFIVEDIQTNYGNIPSISPEEEALFAGWVPSKFMKNGGGH